ncbi:glycosyltransferase family 2 protein [Oceanimonas smirnovii]
MALQAYQSTFEHSVAGVNYSWWLEQQAERHQEQLQVLQSQQPQWAYQPVISILLPVYNTPPTLLAECIHSVTAQLYSNWQLCIADDASTSAETRQALQQLCAGDKRIKLVQRENNGHISAASNSALAVATGDYVALLDHDDLLSPDALLKVAAAINQHPNALLLYSDEDKIDGQGKRYDPHFKPGWNPDLLLSQNYISHLGVYQRQRMVNIGGFREGLEGSQDHDLVLRFTDGLQSQHIVHIPEVLYHWRAVAGSTALGSNEKSYAHKTGLQVLQQYVSKQHPQASVSSTAGDYYRVVWPLPSPAPLVSLLVPTRDGVDILAPCVNAILEKTDYRHFELIILDNQSSCPRTLEYMQQVSERDERVRVLRWDHPFNYSAINNFGASQAKGSIIGLVNNDVEPINAGWLSEMVSQACRPKIGCVGAKLYYPNGSLQHAGVILGIGGVAGHSHKYFNGNALGYFARLQLVQNLSAVTAACLLVRKEVFEQVGGLNEEHLKVAFNDVDFCLKVREAGYRNLFTPFAELYHHESVSRGAEDNPEKQARFQAEIAYMRQTWGPQLDNDPAYNPNLTLAYEDFSLRCLSS